MNIHDGGVLDSIIYFENFTEQTKEIAFGKIKDMTFIMLQHPALDKPFVIHTDASDYAAADALFTRMQRKDYNHSYSRQLNDSEINYSIHDKELFAIKDSLQECRHYIIYVKEPTGYHPQRNRKSLLHFNSSTQM